MPSSTHSLRKLLYHAVLSEPSWLMGCCLSFLLIISVCTTASAHIEFRHYIHTEGQGIACLDCHSPDNANSYNLPDHSICGSCHREQVEADTIEKATCGMCHELENKSGILDVVEVHRESKASEGTFLHTKRLNNLCTTCHKAMLEELVSVGHIRSRDGVERIRRISHNFYFAPDCRHCHDASKFSKTQKPKNHDSNWGKAHAKAAPEFNCRLCHTKTYCQSCHVNTY